MFTRLRSGSRQYKLGVALLVVPFLLLFGTLSLLAIRVPSGLLFPLLAAGTLLELVFATAGVFLILTSPEAQPWAAAGRGEASDR